MSDDTIYRRAALDVLCDNCDNVQAVCAHYPCKQYIAVEKLPSAQPEIKCIAKIMLTEEQVQEVFEKAKKENLL